MILFRNTSRIYSSEKKMIGLSLATFLEEFMKIKCFKTYLKKPHRISGVISVEILQINISLLSYINPEGRLEIPGSVLEMLLIDFRKMFGPRILEDVPRKSMDKILEELGLS